MKVGSSALPQALASLPSTVAPKRPAPVAADVAPTAQKAADGFDRLSPSWKAALAVGAGVAGFAVGGMLGEQVGMSILRDLVPNISMMAFHAIPLATTLGGALLGCAVATSPFHQGEG